MATIDDIRKSNPAVYGKLTEYEIVGRLASLTKQDPSIVAYDLGVQAPNEGGFTTAFKGGLGSMAQSVGQLGADYIPGVEANNPIERYGREVSQRNPVTIMQGASESGFANLGTNLMERPLNTVGQIAGGALSYATPGTAIKLGSAGLRAIRGVQGAAGLGTNAAIGATTILPTYGQMRDEQETLGMNTTADKLKALGSSAVIGAIETVAGPEALLLRGGRAVSPSKSFGGAVLKQGGLEAGEEILQAPIEAYGSGRDVFTAKTLDDAAAGALAGFVGGGVFGGATYPFTRNSTADKLERREPVNVSEADAVEPPGYARRLDRVNAGRATPVRDETLPDVMTVTPTGDVLTNQAQLDAWDAFGKNNQQFTIDFDRAKSKKMLRNSLDAQLQNGVITEEQHIEAVNTIDQHNGAIVKLKNKLKPILAPVAQTEQIAEPAVAPIQQAVQNAETVNLQEAPAAVETQTASVVETPALTFDSVMNRAELTSFLDQQLAQNVITPEQHQQATQKTAKWKKSFDELKEKLAPLVAVTTIRAVPTTKLKTQQLQDFRQNMGGLLRQSLNEAQYEALVTTRGVRNMDDTDWEINPTTGQPMVPMSNAAAGAELGQQAKKISAKANTALKKLHKRAKDLGMSPEAAELILGVQGEQKSYQAPISEAQAVQAGLSFRGQGQTNQDVDAETEGTAEPIAEDADIEDAAGMASEEELGAAVDELSIADIVLSRDVWDTLLDEAEDKNEIASWNDLSEDAQREFAFAVRRNRINPRGEQSVLELQAEQRKASGLAPTATKQGEQDEQTSSGIRETVNAGTEGGASSTDGTVKQATTVSRKKSRRTAVRTEVEPQVTAEVEETVDANDAIDEILSDNLTTAEISLVTSDAQLGNGNYAEGRQKLLSYVAQALRGDNLAFLKKAVRDLVEKVKNGMMAFAVAFNFNTAAPAIPVTVPVDVRVVAAYEKPVDNQEQEVPEVVTAVAAQTLNEGNGSAFMVVDKPNAMVYAYSKEGKLLGKSVALTGKAFGDVMPATTKSLNDFTDADKVTPAGKFTGQFSFSEEYGSIVSLAETNDGSAFVAVHRTYLGTPSEKRAERLDTTTTADNRVSFGCINVPDTFYDGVVATNFMNPSQIVVMPDLADAKKYFNVKEDKIEIVQGTTGTAKKQTTKSDARAIRPTELAAKENQAPSMVTKFSTANTIRFAQQSKPKNVDLPTWIAFIDALETEYAKPEMAKLQAALKNDSKLAGLELDLVINMLESEFDKLDFSVEYPNRTVAQVKGQLKAMFQLPGSFDKLVTLIKNNAELAQMFPDKAEERGTQGFVEKGKVYIVVDNIKPGQEFSVLMHELGVHMGLINAVNSAEFNRLVSQIKEWAAGTGTTQEQQLAKKAMKRMEEAKASYKERGVDAANYKTLKDSTGSTSLLEEELVAYFVDAAVSAGINPQAMAVRRGTTLGKWFADLINVLTNALKKIKMQTNAPLTAQDYVDIAYGVAQLTLDGSLPVRPEGAVVRSVKPSEKSVVSKAVESAKNYTDEIIDAMPPGVADSIRYTQDATSDMAKRGLIYSMFTNDLVESAEKLMPSVRRWYNLVRNRATEQIKREAIIDEIANEVDQLSRPEFERTWNAVLKMTGNQKWGYQPSWRGEVTIDPAMANVYESLSNKEQALLDRIFKHGYDDLKATQDVLNNILNSEFEQKLKEAKTPEERATIARQERKFKEMFGRKLSELEGPYAPMRRVGSHVVVARSQALMDAIDIRDTKAIDEMRTDPRHYTVMFFDSMAEAKREERKLVKERKFPATGVRSSQKDNFASSIQMLPFEAFDQIRQMASEKEGDAAKKLSNLVTELYLTSLAETSARKSELRRENIAGLNADTMYKAFVSKGRASAHYIANLKNNREIGNAMAQMRQEAKAGTDMVVFNELATRYANNLKFDPAPLASKIMAFNAIWSLLTKPAYYVYNATQPALMTLPLLTQKFKYADAASAMTQAYKDIAGAKNFLSISDASIHIESMPKDVQRVLQDLLDSGKLDINITQDLGARLAAGQGDISRAAANVSRVLRTAAQKVETANRLVSGIAAYRLATEKGMAHAEAVDYAAEVIDSTQGDYSNFNAPRLFNQTAFQRVATQFRKFQLIQITFIVKMVKQAFAGATKAERAAAMKSLGFVLGHHAILAGGLGLPAANVIAMVYSAASDDDEPRDLEVDIRKALGNGFMADLVTRGAPAAILNVNVSSNVGMGQAFSILPFADGDITSREGYASAVVAGMGPFFGGVLPQMLTAMGSMYKGDYYKGLEGLMPSGARTALRALREATQGVTNTRGDELVSPDEVSLMHSIAKALGFRTNDDAVRQLIRSKTFEYDKFFKDRTSLLKNQYAKAYRDGDTDAMMEARESWLEMNQFKRDYGFTTQPISNLLKAPRERMERESDTVDGIQVRKNNRRFVESLTEEE